MRYVKLALLLILTLTLAGCDDDFFDNGAGDGGSGHETYHGVQEVLSRRGYVGMTQKQEPPAPQGDQEDCPTVMVLLMLILLLVQLWEPKSTWAGQF